MNLIAAEPREKTCDEDDGTRHPSLPPSRQDYARGRVVRSLVTRSSGGHARPWVRLVVCDPISRRAPRSSGFAKRARGDVASPREAPADGEARPPPRRYVDIGANLTDGMFRGEYHGKKVHREDLARVLLRARDAGVETVLVTAGTLEEAEDAFRLAETFDPRAPGDGSAAAARGDASAPALFTTVGVHPTRCDAFEDSGDPEVLREARGLRDAAQTRRRAYAFGGDVFGERHPPRRRRRRCGLDTTGRSFARRRHS